MSWVQGRHVTETTQSGCREGLPSEARSPLPGQWSRDTGPGRGWLRGRGGASPRAWPREDRVTRARLGWTHPTLPPLDACCGDVPWGDCPSAVPTAVWSTCQRRGPAAPAGPPAERKLGTGASMRFASLSLMRGREKRREGPPMRRAVCKAAGQTHIPWGSATPAGVHLPDTLPSGQEGHLSRAREDTAAEGQDAGLRGQESGHRSHRAAVGGGEGKGTLTQRWSPKWRIHSHKGSEGQGAAPCKRSREAPGS